MHQRFLSFIIFFSSWMLFIAAQVFATTSDTNNTIALVVVREKGIYRVGFSDLKQAGINPEKLDPRDLNLINRTTPVPIKFKGEEDGKFDSEDYFEFWGTFNEGTYTFKDIYSDDNIYFLISDSKKSCRYRELTEHEVDKPDTYQPPEGILYKTEHFEELREKKWHHFKNFGGEPTDFAFWSWVDSRQRTFRNRFDLPALAPGKGPSVLRVKVYGRSNLPVEPDHHVVVTLNFKKIGDFTFDGTTGYLFESKEIQPTLITGQNDRIEVILPGDLEHAKKVSPPDSTNANSDVAFDWVYMDWYEIEYPIKFIAREDLFEGYTRDFTSSPIQALLTVTGFSSNECTVFDIKNQITATPRALQEDSGAYSQIFPVLLNNMTSIYISAKDKIKKPERIALFEKRDLLTHCKDANLVIITHDDFYQESAPLKEWKETQNKKTAIVRISDIYNEYNFGLKHPIAIKNFIRELMNSPDSALRYILLLGSASQDHKNLFGNARKDLIPAYYYSSILFTAFATDNWFVNIDNDESGVPELAIGRIPAGSKYQVRSAIEKIIVFERNAQSKPSWLSKALLIASYEEGMTFRTDSVAKTILEKAKDFHVLKAYATEDTLFKDDRAEDIMRHFNDGIGFVYFIGHGGNNVWQAGPTRLKAKNLFDLDHVEALKNKGKYPIVITATCYTTAFDTPADEESIGVKLVHRKEGGAVSVIGTPQRSLLEHDLLFMKTIIGYLFEAKCQTLGDAFIRSKQEIKYRDIMESVTLLGDPSLDTSWLVH